jgi:hypothetical protein
LRFGAAVLPLKIFPKNIFFTILILVKFEVFEIFDVVDAVVDAVDGVDGVDGVIKYHTTYFHEKLKTRNFLKSFLFLREFPKIINFPKLHN